ncbi:MAG: hypothetical protein MUO54_02720 [Anaerolineales bacterium]|nr:hypothetical protein [Anaerolineales bacterium]
MDGFPDRLFGESCDGPHILPVSLECGQAQAVLENQVSRVCKGDPLSIEKKTTEDNLPECAIS